MDLAVVCAAVIVFGVLMYVVLDGFDLGVGILFPWMPGGSARDTAVASIAPMWDGNETWLILGGAVLFAAFPVAYAAALPAFYVPLMALLLSLILRGVSFEFRHKAVRTRRAWDVAFCGGSTGAAFCQGLLLGGLLEGVTLVDRRFAGSPWEWLTPFSIVVGFGVVAGYALLGATWLNLKTEGPLRAFAQRAARVALLGALVALATVSIYTPLKFPQIAERWFADLHWVWLSPMPAGSALAAALLWRELGRGAHLAPFLLAIALFVLGYVGIGVSLWPHIVPPSLTIWQAAAPRSSQVFTLIQLAITLPMVLIYTGYAYWVFRGKVLVDSGYGAH
jgi:cytochrome bd ubiquinol oxidase subunit II